MIEDRCQSWPNTLATVVTPGEMCIFTAQRSRTAGNERMLLEEMAQMLVRIARMQGFQLARVGISSLHQQSVELLRAYHEAASALESGHSTVNCFETLPAPDKQPAQALGRVLKALQLADSTATSASVRESLASAAPAAASVSQLQQARGLLTWACEHLARELGNIGVGVSMLNAAKDRAAEIIMSSPSSFAMAEAFREYVDKLRLQMVQMFSQREEKIVNETHRLLSPLRLPISPSGLFPASSLISSFSYT